MRLARFAAVGLVAWALVPAALAQPAQARQFGIPGHGSLVLDVPSGWRVSERPPLGEPPSASLQIAPPSGRAFLLQVTAVWFEPQKLAKYTPQEVRAGVERSAAELLSRAVEKQATYVELRGKDAYGYHFSLTDREAKANDPDDFKHVTQGTLVAGELVAIFTFLHRDPGAREKPQVLQMLADARHSRDAVPPRQDALQVKDLAQGYELSVPVSRLVMTIPKAGMPGARRGPSESSHPRYFYFVDGALNVSGWFEPASGFKGMKSFWDGETEAWRRRGLPAPVDTAFAKIGNWDAVTYDIASPAGTNSHIRAHWVQAGTWIDIHLSITAKRPSSETRARLAELLRTIEVTERR